MSASSKCFPAHIPLQSPRHQLCCPTAYTEASSQPARLTPPQASAPQTSNKKLVPVPGQDSFVQEVGPGVAPLGGPLCPSASPAQYLRDMASVPPWGQHHGLQLHFSLAGKQPPRHKCGNQKGCPEDHFAFKIISGAANVVGPSICFNDIM